MYDRNFNMRMILSVAVGLVLTLTGIQQGFAQSGPVSSNISFLSCCVGGSTQRVQWCCVVGFGNSACNCSVGAALAHQEPPEPGTALDGSSALAGNSDVLLLPDSDQQPQYGDSRIDPNFSAGPFFGDTLPEAVKQMMDALCKATDCR